MNSWDLEAMGLKPRLPEILSSSDATPGRGHPGAMTIREKLYARRHAAKRTQ